MANNYINYPHQFQNNNYNQNYQSKQNNDQGYSSSSYIINNEYQSQNLSNQIPYNIRNTEFLDISKNNPLFQNKENEENISRMTEYDRGKERPLWSYREIKYDQFKQPRNTEVITTTSLTKKSNIPKQNEIQRKSNNLEELQEKDKIYFNNIKYKKVKVTKKLKNENEFKKIPRKGPEDDFEQKNQNNDNDEYDYKQNKNIFENQNNIPKENKEINLEKDNYQIDLDTLEEANSIKNQHLEEEDEEEEYIPQLKYNNDNEIDNKLGKEKNEYLIPNLNNRVNQKPTFIENTTKKVNEIIDEINNIPEACLEKWNLVADYIP